MLRGVSCKRTHSLLGGVAKETRQYEGIHHPFAKEGEYLLVACVLQCIPSKENMKAFIIHLQKKVNTF